MTTFDARARSRGPLGFGSRLAASFFFLFFLAMGLVFCWLIAREALAGLRTWTWTKTDCEILQSRVNETGPRGRRTGQFYLDVRYCYRSGNRVITSDLHTLKPVVFSDYGKASRVVDAYPKGAHATCFVNPADPTQAVLQRGSLLFPLAILFPLIFVAIGGIGVYSVWRPPTGRPTSERVISDRASGTFAPRFAIAFFGIFMVLGLVLSYVLSVRPLARVLSARHWQKVPCTVISSQVQSHSGDHGNTYSVNILYSYVVNGQAHRSNRYEFMGGSSSGFASKQAIVARFPPGSSGFCYVDPTDFSQAVLERGLTPFMWIGLLPLAFFFAGLAGVVSTLRKSRFQKPAADRYSGPGAALEPVFESAAPEAPATLTFQRGASPASKFFGVVVAALFWNGIISVFLVQLLKSWRSGAFEWFLAVFLTPFVLVGIGLVVAAGYFFLALFNPRPRVTISPSAPRLGDSLRVDWEIRGRVESLQNLRLTLEGREEAIYTRGTRTATDRSVFARLEVASTTAAQEIRSGTGNVVLPSTLMHSFDSRHNKIIWSLRIEGEIPRWPDLKDEFRVRVLPGGRTTGMKL